MPAVRSPAVTPLLPVQFAGSPARFARGVRAGRWCFATGQSAVDYETGLAPEVLSAGNPLNGVPKAKREAIRLFRNVEGVLREAQCSFSDVVRIDQYYTDARAVDPYHETRREVFNGRIPPSTSNLHRRFLRAQQEIEVQVVAAIPNDRFRAEHQTFEPAYEIHSSSGYSPGLMAGDFRFIPGQTAEARILTEGPLDPEARMPAGHLWKGTPIKLETDFIVRRKLIPSLQAAGTNLENVLKAQVYLRDRDDVPAFNETWLSYFKAPPATTIIPTESPGFIISDARIEINTISLVAEGRTKKEVIATNHDPLFAGHISAVKAGDLLLLSGLMAIERGALIAGAKPAEREPYFAIPVKREIESIAEQAEAICHKAGTTLTNTVRLQTFHTDLRDFPPALEAWHVALGGCPLPISTIEVPWLPVAGARVLADVWVYAP
jgi:enamine deaminase RidA (YjgF/YER057c/UK114 family)